MRRWPLVALAIALVASPALAGYARNEWWIDDQLDALVGKLPHETSAIGLRVGNTSTPCEKLVAQALATTLPRNKVARFFAEQPLPVQLAWSTPGGFRHWQSGGSVTPIDEGRLPPPVHKLLVEHAFLPRGVHRAVVYRRVALPHHADPRCWRAH